jgi:hypothetical protein
LARRRKTGARRSICGAPKRQWSTSPRSDHCRVRGRTISGCPLGRRAITSIVMDGSSNGPRPKTGSPEPPGPHGA